jgi:hypothetical protein
LDGPSGGGVDGGPGEQPAKRLHFSSLMSCFIVPIVKKAFCSLDEELTLTNLAVSWTEAFATKISASSEPF